MRAQDCDILIIPGLGGSGPDHWQSRWQRRLKTARRVEQPDWNRPDRAIWKASVAAALQAAHRPVVMIAHSLGVISAVDAALSLEGSVVAAALLVAPPDTEDPHSLAAIQSFGPPPRGPLPCPAFLVASRTDPFSTFVQSQTLAEAWGADFLDGGESGHLNEDSGHGPWPEGLLILARLLRRAGPRPVVLH